MNDEGQSLSSLAGMQAGTDAEFDLLTGNEHVQAPQVPDADGIFNSPVRVQQPGTWAASLTNSNNPPAHAAAGPSSGTKRSLPDAEKQEIMAMASDVASFVCASKPQCPQAREAAFYLKMKAMHIANGDLTARLSRDIDTCITERDSFTFGVAQLYTELLQRYGEEVSKRAVSKSARRK